MKEALKAILKKNGFSVDVANDGIQGLDLAVSRIHDIIILDRMLPGKTGLDFDMSTAVAEIIDSLQFMLIFFNDIEVDFIY